MKWTAAKRIFNQNYSILRSSHTLSFLAFASLFLIATACSTTKRTALNAEFYPSTIDAESLLVQLPNYGKDLNTIKGKGRALVSEPGNSERVTIDFEADQALSLLTIRNRIGIEGGQLLVDQDSILIYNKIDKIAQKISVYDGRATSLNELASINIIDLLNFSFEETQIIELLESKNSYQVKLKNGAEVYISKSDMNISRVIQQDRLQAPYSEISYEGYGEIEGFSLPRRVTIISGDQKSKVVFLIRSLDINPGDLALEADIPNDIIIERL